MAKRAEMDIPTFIAKLGEVKDKYTWKVDLYDAHIRGFLIEGGNPTDQCVCPVTAVCYIVTGDYFQEGDLDDAGKAIGLSDEEISEIGYAADYFARDLEAPQREIRALLLSAIGHND